MNIVQNSSFTLGSYHSDAWFLHITNACISDSSGELEIYTNGTNIYNSDSIIENGDSINKGYLNEFYNYDGFYTLLNGVLFLPSLKSSNNYDLFHLRGDSIVSGNPQIDNSGAVENLLRSTIQSNENGFQVIEKDYLLLEDTLVNCGVSACRHGNGRDWFIVVGEAYNNCYNVFLYSPDSIKLTSRQCLGIVITPCCILQILLSRYINNV